MAGLRAHTSCCNSKQYAKGDFRGARASMDSLVALRGLAALAKLEHSGAVDLEAARARLEGERAIK